MAEPTTPTLDRAEETQPHAEFEGQVATLVHHGVPEAMGLSAGAFRRQLAPLRARLRNLQPAPDASGRLPFVIVAAARGAVDALRLVDLNGKGATSMMDAQDLVRFEPAPGLTVPAGAAYLLLDVDTGRETLNTTPDDALGRIEAAGRSPLTIEEGIAVLIQSPDILKRENAFSLLGSRCGDRRVAALWMSKGHPKLGWCWAGNPHSWLGSASCRTRVAPEGD